MSSRPHTRSLARAALVALVALTSLGAAACADDGDDARDEDTGAADSASDTATDTGADTQPDTAPTDTGDDAPPDADTVEPTGCAALARAGNGFFVHGAGPSTQIHPQVAFDGDSGIWVTWAQPDGQGEGGFDIFASRLGCDGRPELAPFAVHPPSRENEIDPELAVATDGSVLIAWGRDKSAVDPNDPANLDILYTLLEPDGSPRLATPRVLETTRGAAPVTGNAWEASVVARPDGGFLLAATRGDDTNACFLAFAQQIGADGELDGEAVDVGVDPVACDRHPRADYAPDSGTLWLTFTRQPTVDDPETPMRVEIPPGATAPAAAPVPLIDGVDGVTSDLAVLPDGRVLRVLGTEDGAIVVDDGTLRLALGAPATLETGPGVALAADGLSAAVFYFRLRQGFQADVVVQRLDVSGGGLAAAGEPLVVTGTQPSAPYGPAIAHVAGDVWFVAWPEGANPDFKIRGRLIEP